MIRAYNPSCLGGWDGEDWGGASLGKMFEAPPPLSQQKLGIVVHACHPSVNRRITVQACLGINMRPYLKNNTKRAGSWLKWLEYLSGKCKALSSSSSTTQRIKKSKTYSWNSKLLINTIIMENEPDKIYLKNMDISITWM
jgi:hypothetical protein